MISKFIKGTLITTLTLGLFTFQVNSAEATSKVMWGKTELKVGQIGKVTILKDTALVSMNSEGKLHTIRTLSKGDEYRVYQYKGQHGGLYGVGNSSFLQKNDSNILYETPSKKKLELVNEKDKELVIEDVSNVGKPTVITSPSGISIIPTHPVSSTPPKEKEPVTPISEETIKAEKLFKKLVGNKYEVGIEPITQILTVANDVDEIIYYSFGEIYEHDPNTPHNLVMIWDSNKETYKLTYDLIKSIGFPLSEKEYMSIINKSQKEHDTIDKGKVSIFAVGSHTTITW